MNSDVYIFGYQSMLAQGSLATSVTSGYTAWYPIPARLAGYIRNWSAVREYTNNEAKRYVHTSDWRVTERVAFANLLPSSGTWVNGVCQRIPADRVSELDFREQGYMRIEVSQDVSPYEHYQIDKSIKCFTYIDPSPAPASAMVSQAYYDMGRIGALGISKVVPTFFADYQNSTEPPALLATDLGFIFFSGDGRHLWLLDESDSSLVLLHKLTASQFLSPRRNPPEIVQRITPSLKWFDARYRTAPTGLYDPHLPPKMIRELILNPKIDELSTSAYWLCRLTAADAATCIASLEALANDSDYWVRRSARLRKQTVRGTIPSPTEPDKSILVVDP